MDKEAEISDETKYELLRQIDTFDKFRQFIQLLAVDTEAWAGIPMPLGDQPLVIEPRFPNAKLLMSIGAAKEKPADNAKVDELLDSKLRNIFWSWHKRADIYVYQTKDGRIDWGLIPRATSITQQLHTLGASDVWGIEQERKALDLLGGMIRHRQFKQYLLTGSFLERSERSHVSYMFRKLRPTIAIKENAAGTGMKVLAVLCMHPIAYYEDSWAGAMTPTDDVVAHLAMMRGDEHLFWKRCNQHPAWRPEAGV